MYKFRTAILDNHNGIAAIDMLGVAYTRTAPLSINNIDNMYKPIVKTEKLPLMKKPVPMEVDTPSTKASSSEKKGMVPIKKEGQGKGASKGHSNKKMRNQVRKIKNQPAGGAMVLNTTRGRGRHKEIENRRIKHVTTAETRATPKQSGHQ